MQVTSSVAYGLDVEKRKTDIDYNVAAGADSLLEKRTWTPVIGDGDTRSFETWFYAVWAYNGWTAGNPYPYRVWRRVAKGPQGWWTSVPVTPVPKSSLVGGLGVAMSTPQPAHYWSPAPLPRPTLSAPRAPHRRTSRCGSAGGSGTGGEDGAPAAPSGGAGASSSAQPPRRDRWRGGAAAPVQLGDR